jgi:hypothetical protein
MPVTEKPVARINNKQIAMLLARLNNIGLKNDKDRYDWLLETAEVNVNDFSEITQSDFNHQVIPHLLEAEKQIE